MGAGGGGGGGRELSGKKMGVRRTMHIGSFFSILGHCWDGRFRAYPPFHLRLIDRDPQ